MRTQAAILNNQYLIKDLHTEQIDQITKTWTEGFARHFHYLAIPEQIYPNQRLSESDTTAAIQSLDILLDLRALHLHGSIGPIQKADCSDEVLAQIINMLKRKPPKVIYEVSELVLNYHKKLFDEIDPDSFTTTDRIINTAKKEALFQSVERLQQAATTIANGFSNSSSTGTIYSGSQQVTQ